MNNIVMIYFTPKRKETNVLTLNEILTSNKELKIMNLIWFI